MNSRIPEFSWDLCPITGVAGKLGILSPEFEPGICKNLLLRCDRKWL